MPPPIKIPILKDFGPSSVRSHLTNFLTNHLPSIKTGMITRKYENHGEDRGWGIIQNQEYEISINRQLEIIYLIACGVDSQPETSLDLKVKKKAWLKILEEEVESFKERIVGRLTNLREEQDSGGGYSSPEREGGTSG